MALTVIGAPAGVGAARNGCEAGPRALRVAGLHEALAATGRSLVDIGDVAYGAPLPVEHGNPRLRSLPEVAAWAAAIRRALLDCPADATPILLGGDHSVSLGSVPAMAERAAATGRPFYMLWIDAHPDCHTLDTSVSGNLHGTPVAFALGEPGFETYLPYGPLVDGEKVMMLGIRDIDLSEADVIARNGIAAHDPGSIRRLGVRSLLEPWLARIRDVGGVLHVSLDADALDPDVAPGVGTPVPGGLSIAEAKGILRAVAASGVLGSLELVEVNPLLDRDGRTARVMVELAAESFSRSAEVERFAPVRSQA